MDGTQKTADFADERLLNLPHTATQAEVRQAYKRESLKSHPDRVANATPDEKRRSTG